MENLSKQSLQAIKEIVETAVDDRVSISTDILRQEIRALETRTDKKFERLEQKFEHKLDETEGRIMGAISDIHDVLVRPRFDDLERRVKRLETKIA